MNFYYNNNEIKKTNSFNFVRTANSKFYWSRFFCLWSIERQATYKRHLQYDVFFFSLSFFFIHILTFLDSSTQPFNYLWLCAYDSVLFTWYSRSSLLLLLLFFLASAILKSFAGKTIRYGKILEKNSFDWVSNSNVIRKYSTYRKIKYCFLLNFDKRFVDVCDLSVEFRKKSL